MSSQVLAGTAAEAPVAPLAGSPASAGTPRHVRQRAERDCGVAAAAMLAGVGYRRALGVHPPERPGGGLQAMDVAIMLRRLTGRLVRLSGAAEGLSLAEWAASAESPAIVLIHEPGSTRGHYVVVANGRVLDPEQDAVAPVEAYRHRAWSVFRVLTLESEPVATAA